MGIPTRIAADEAPLLRAALAAFAGWASVSGSSSLAPLTIRLGTAVAAPAEADARCEVRVDGSRLRLDGGGIQGEADADRREGWCTVPPDLVADPARLAAEVLDTLVLFLLTRSGRIPLHAAGILLGDTAILLAGPSGSGKSTLALTADRAGIPVLSEDTVYLQLRPNFRVWGSPRPIHLLPDDAALDATPGNSADVALRLRNGRWKLALPLHGSAGHGPAARRAVLCLLERGDAVSLRPLDPARAVERLLSSLDPGFDHFREVLPAALEAAAAGGAWTLTLAFDPSRRHSADLRTATADTGGAVTSAPAAAIALLQRQFGG